MFTAVERLWMGIGVLILVLVVAAYAVYISRKIKTYEDYQLASRDVGLLPMILTIVGTGIGGAMLLGYTTDSYLMGTERIWMVAPATLFVTPLFILFLITPIMNIGRKYRMVSICDFTALRYGEAARYPSALCTLIAYCGITGMQYIAVATFLRVVLGVPQGWGIFLGFLFIAAKTYLGGLKVIVFSDTVYGIMQTLGVIITFVVVLIASGGYISAARSAPSLGLPADFMNPFTMPVNTLMIFVLTIGAYQILRQDRWQRIFAAKTGKINVAANWWAVLVSFLTSAMVVSIGALAHAGLGMQIEAPALAYYAIVHEVLPLGLAVIVVTAVVATVISCGDSFLMSGSLTFMNDVVKPYMKSRKMAQDEKTLVAWSRYSMAITAILALGLAFYMPNLILLWVMGTAMLTGGMFFPVLAGFFWKKATNTAGLLALWGGLLVTAFWQLAKLQATTGAHPVFIGMPVSLVLLVVVSFFTKPSDPELVESLHYSNNNKIQDEGELGIIDSTCSGKP